MKPMRTRQLLYATTALTSALGLSAMSVNVASANPVDGNVVAGSATISVPNPSTVQIDQSSQNAIINWRSFNIEAGETTRFVQPNSSSWTLNRVTGEMEPTRILGTLEANGNVAIVNPDGILFSEGSRVDVNGLIATTHDIANDDFMAGRFNFTQPGNPSASVVNEGQISIGDYGIGAFVAPGVRNSGVITAKLGTVSLASGNAFTLDLYGDNLIHLLVGDEITEEVIDVATGQPVADLVKNEGRISADGGTVALKAATARRAVNSVINNTGVIEANSVGVRNGKIILGAQTADTKTAGAPVQRVKVSGTLSATNITLPSSDSDVPLPTWRPDGEGTGGTIEITGELIEVAAATIDVSGTAGGGKVLIGGDYLGGRASDETMATLEIEREAQAIPTASYVSLDAATTINADALVDGDGGKVVVWSDVATVTAAQITARGGAEGGDGGFIETSGKYLDVRAAADASAAKGTSGTWLLDPIDMYIQDVASSSNTDDFFFDFEIGAGLSGTRVVPTDTPSIVDTDFIESALNTGTNVQISSYGDFGVSEQGTIVFLDGINKTAGGDATLNINAAGNINFLLDTDISIISTSGKLDLLLYATTGSINGQDFGTLDLNGGNLEMAARDQVDFHTASPMPTETGISIRPFESSPEAGNYYSLSFGSGDIIDFNATDTSHEFTAGSIKLTDPGSTSLFYLEFYNGDIGIADNAIEVTNGRTVEFIMNHDPGYYYIGGAGGNNVPEIVSDGTIKLRYKPGPALFEPTVEVNAVDPPNCIGINCVQVVSMQPQPEVPQDVDHPENRLEQITDPVFYGPLQPTPEQRLDWSLENISMDYCRWLAGSSCSSIIVDFIFDGIKSWIKSEIDGNSQEIFAMIFSNPGAFVSDRDRLREFESLLSDPQFMTELSGQLAKQFMTKLSVNMAKALAQAIIIEQSAKMLERAGYAEFAETVRLVAGPSIAVAKMVTSIVVGEGAIGGPALTAVSVWTQNSIEFIALGIELAKARREGTDVGQQIVEMSALQSSYIETLISGKLTGSAFEEANQNETLSPELQAIIRSNLLAMPELSADLTYSDSYQRWLQDSAEAVGKYFLPIVDAAEAVGGRNLGTGPTWLLGQ